MISKPLFKQSCKANAGIWVFVTGITCAMLIITILVMGNLNVNEIRTSMMDMFIKDAVESEVQRSSMTYYDMTDTALKSYDNTCELLDLDSSISGMIIAYNSFIQSGKSDEEAREMMRMLPGMDDQKFATLNDLLDIYVEKGGITEADISNYVLNKIADEVYAQLLDEQGEEYANAAKDFITAAITAFAGSGESVTEFATDYIPGVVSDVYYQQSFDYDDRKIYISDYFTKEKLTNTSYSAIISFRAELEFKEKQLTNSGEYTEEEIAQALNAYKQTVIEDKSRTMFYSLPEKVTTALSELGSMDVYELVIGSMLYRIAGLLLPMIFVIMTANNLIAGQVDTGAMAYVLSTPIKRKKVTLTQMCYLIFSLFAMFAFTSITGVISLALVKGGDFTITYGQILLLNLGAFITMFAVSGICFLASSWFNRSKLSMSFGGGLSMFFLVATILGLFGSNVIPSAIRIEAMKYFNYVSVISLFDAISIMDGSLTYLWKLAILLAVGAITYAAGIIKFNKKDLPL
jgi:ABC-2 type transport system permease protein